MLKKPFLIFHFAKVDKVISIRPKISLKLRNYIDVVDDLQKDVN